MGFNGAEVACLYCLWILNSGGGVRLEVILTVYDLGITLPAHMSRTADRGAGIHSSWLIYRVLERVNFP